MFTGNNARTSIYRPQDKRYEIEYILCERITIVPERNAGPVQYLIKFKNYQFKDCCWVHQRSIYPIEKDTPLADWNQLNAHEKQERYIFLNKINDFIDLTNLEKTELGWKYAERFGLDILTQTPELVSKSSSPNVNKKTYSWNQ